MRPRCLDLLLVLFAIACGGDAPEPLPIPDLSQAAEASPDAHVNPPLEETETQGSVPFSHEDGLEGLGQNPSPNTTSGFQPVVVPLDGPSERTWEWEFKAKKRKDNGEALRKSGKPKVPFSELIDDEREAARLRSRGR
jgi:hypothetical protein